MEEVKMLYSDQLLRKNRANRSERVNGSLLVMWSSTKPSQISWTFWITSFQTFQDLPLKLHKLHLFSEKIPSHIIRAIPITIHRCAWKNKTNPISRLEYYAKCQHSNVQKRTEEQEHLNHSLLPLFAVLWRGTLRKHTPHQDPPHTSSVYCTSS